MKNKELFQSFIGKTVMFNSLVESIEADPDEGMVARIIRIEETKYGDGCLEVFIDLSEFFEHNKILGKANYYDSHGFPCKTWFEKSYPANHKYSFFINEDIEKYPLPFALLTDTDKIIAQTITDKERIDWLNSGLYEAYKAWLSDKNCTEIRVIIDEQIKMSQK